MPQGYEIAKKVIPQLRYQLGHNRRRPPANERCLSLLPLSASGARCIQVSEGAVSHIRNEILPDRTTILSLD